jgi:hypothetical protein
LLGKIFESKSHVSNKIEKSLLHALQNLEKARLEREIDLLNRINLLEKEVASLKALKLPSVPSLAALLKDNIPELAKLRNKLIKQKGKRDERDREWTNGRGKRQPRVYHYLSR